MTTPSEEDFVKETRWLMSLNPEQRIKYVNSILESLAESLKQITKQESQLEKMKAAQQFFNELNDKTVTLLPPIIYAVKPEFQPTIIKIIKEFSQLL